MQKETKQSRRKTTCLKSHRGQLLAQPKKNSANRTLQTKRTRGRGKNTGGFFNLEDSFGQISVVLLCDLGLVGGPVKHGRIVVDVIDVNNDRRIVFVQIVRGDQTQLVL